MDVERGVDDVITAAEAACERGRLRPAGLARRLHDGPIQRLCGVAAALGAPAPLSAGTRQRCKREVEAAIADLRALISEGVGDEGGGEAPRTLAAAVREGCGEEGAQLRVDGDAKLPPEQARLVRDFVAEALRNAGKHGRPSTVSIEVEVSDCVARVEVANDGVDPGRAGAGTRLGLRLLRAEAARHGGGLDARRVGRDRWRTVLTLPLAGAGLRVRRFERTRTSRVGES